MKRFAMLGFAAMIASSGLSAQTLLQDNFNAENGGNTQLNYSAFANWTTGGNVDLVQHGAFGISCIGGVGSCIDLDGTSGPGSIISQYFAFNAGDKMKFSVQVSGNQREAAQFDAVRLGLQFAAPVTMGNYTGTGGFNYAGFVGTPMNAFAVNAVAIAGNTAFSLWTFEFQALDAGSVQYSLGTSSSDNVGPIIDNVQIDRVSSTVVTPEPSTWAMLAFGMSAVGFVSRRKVRRS